MTNQESDPPEKPEVKLVISAEDPSKGDQGLLEKIAADLREQLPGLLSSIASSGGGFLRGKSLQQQAIAQKIVSDTVDKIGRLAIEEREQKHRQGLETKQAKEESLRAADERYLDALERVTAVAIRLTEAGYEVDIGMLLQQLPTTSPTGVNAIEDS